VTITACIKLEDDVGEKRTVAKEGEDIGSTGLPGARRHPYYGGRELTLLKNQIFGGRIPKTMANCLKEIMLVAILNDSTVIILV
jgi:hypothetical protein